MEEVLGQIARAAQAYPHRAAYKGSDGTLTYAALWAKAQAAAGLLRRQGRGPSGSWWSRRRTATPDQNKNSARQDVAKAPAGRWTC